jgi:hypothetical protein
MQRPRFRKLLGMKSFSSVVQNGPKSNHRGITLDSQNPELQQESLSGIANQSSMTDSRSGAPRLLNYW